MKKISIIGSTGSIGVNSLNVIRHLGEGYQVVALAAGKNIDLLEQQVKEFKPELVAVYNEEKALELKKRLPGVRIETGLEGVCEVARYSKANYVISAMTGTLGIAPTIAAIQAGKDVGLANKEALVSGGELVMNMVKEKGVKLLPIDSEHSALFQCLTGERSKNVRRLILTASGGPFRDFSKDQLKNISVQSALNHPTWSMGPKITIDSSTLMNKGLEVIEAHYLFDIPLSQIDVVVHPQSVIHSMIEFCDGSMKAQMSAPSMVIPIQYALTYPDRSEGTMKPFDFIRYGKLEFYLPDTDKFRCLACAFEALKVRQSLPGYMNAANEVLVQRFLDGQIAWTAIAEKLETLMTRHTPRSVDSLEKILEVDTEARVEAQQI